MNAQTNIIQNLRDAPAGEATIEQVFEAWRALNDRCDAPHTMTEVESNALCDEIRDLALRIMEMPVAAPLDVSRKVVVALDQPNEGDTTFEAMLIREARMALGMKASVSSV